MVSTRKTFLKPAPYVMHHCGGVNALARIVSRDPSSVSKWAAPAHQKGCDGEIPRACRAAILAHAKKAELPITPEHLEYGGWIMLDLVDAERTG
jgi:hypothetical protein